MKGCQKKPRIKENKEREMKKKKKRKISKERAKKKTMKGEGNV